MELHELAGKKAPFEMLENIPNLVSLYYIEKPDTENQAELVNFGTSGHRGSSKKRTFTETHILAIAQAICDYRKINGITGPLFIGKDTHALSEPAFITVLEVLAANEVMFFTQENNGYTPTPVISHAILNYNKKNKNKADGIVITPSHNPPSDGGIKYDPPSAGPADTNVTSFIADKANEYIKNGNKNIKRIDYSKAVKSEFCNYMDYKIPYIEDLSNVIDMEAIKNSKIKIGADALGGSGFEYWPIIADMYGLDIEVINGIFDPRFSFMTVDKDGKIRMDCSSKYAMANLISLRNKYDIAFGNDPDFDRHGVVVKSSGLLESNSYLAVVIDYLLSHRNWDKKMLVGKTLVTTSIIDRIVKSHKRKLAEVPVGFKWFVDGVLNKEICIGVEESAGGHFIRKNGEVWTTDKDGITLNLLAAEILAVTGKDPGSYYEDLTNKFGKPYSKRIDVATTFEEKEKIKNLNESNITAKEIAGEQIKSIITKAPYNNASLGGVKIVTENAWCAVRPSGTEDIYKIYAESFKGEEHLDKFVEVAEEVLNQVLK
jgi:phosphoglucomutase